MFLQKSAGVAARHRDRYHDDDGYEATAGQYIGEVTERRPSEGPHTEPYIPPDVSYSVGVYVYVGRYIFGMGEGQYKDTGTNIYHVNAMRNKYNKRRKWRESREKIKSCSTGSAWCHRYQRLGPNWRTGALADEVE